MDFLFSDLILFMIGKNLSVSFLLKLRFDSGSLLVLKLRFH